MTPFEQALHDVRQGNVNTPDVSSGAGKLDFFQFQFANHKFYLKIFKAGIKHKQLKLKDLKWYYGLKSKTAEDCYNEFLQIESNYINNKI